jgi:hypothetical protein
VRRISKACQSYGASVWTEVYCRSKGASEPVVPTDITSALASATTPVPETIYTGTCPSNELPTNPATATDTSTEPTPKKSDSGCSLSAGHAVHTLGPWSIALASLLFVALRRRRG